jgi:hypothetical protein
VVDFITHIPARQLMALMSRKRLGLKINSTV